MPRYLVPTAQDFGALIRGFRKQRGWTQARLAEHAGLLPKTVSAIELGGGQVLFANVMRCLSALELDLSLDSRTDSRMTPVVRLADDRPKATPVKVRARKTAKDGVKSQAASVTKALEEKW